MGSTILRANSTPPNDVHQHGHSLYLNLLGEMGIAGFIAAMLFMIAYFRKFKVVFAQSRYKLALLGIFAFIVSCAVHNIFDAYHTKPAMLWPLAILAGAAIAQPSPHIKTQSTNRPWWVLTLIGFAWLGVWTITPYYQAVDLANQNQWQQAYDTFQLAVKRDPGNALAHQQLGLSAAVLAQEGDQNMLAVAIQELESTIQYEPSWALNHANLAALYLVNNDLDNAVLSAEQAAMLAPRAPLYALNLGYILEQSGIETLAQTAYQKALDLNTVWSTASYWEETNLRAESRNFWMQSQPASEPLTLEAAQKILANNNQFSWAYNRYAAVLLEKGYCGCSQENIGEFRIKFI